MNQNRKNHWKRAAAGLVAAALLSGCTLTERLESTTGQDAAQHTAVQRTDRIGLAYYTAEPVNPVTSRTDINVILCNALYEGLFVLDDTFTPQNVLCESYEVSPDGLVYTLKLVDGVTFWSGAPLTATDVVESLRYAKSTAGARYYSRFLEVEQIAVVDSKTVRIRLTQPNANLISLLDVPVFRAGTAKEPFSDGTGPFMPVRENGAYHLVAYPDWHGELNPEIDSIELVSTVRAKSVVHSFSTGDVSMIRTERICDDPLSPSGAVDVYQTPSTELHYLGANMKRQLPAISEFRRAVSVLIDRASICENALQTYADPVLLPQQPQPVTVTEQSYLADLDQAMKLFAQIGISDTNGDGYLDYAAEHYLNRQPVVLTILTNAENSYKQAVLSQISLALSQAGIQTVITAVDFQTYQTELMAGNYDFYYGDVVLQPDFDVRPLIATGNTLNYGGYTDPVMDSLLTAKRTQGTEAAEQMFQNYFLQQMPIIPIAFERMQVVLRGGLIQNYETAPAQMFVNYPAWRMN